MSDARVIRWGLLLFALTIIAAAVGFGWRQSRLAKARTAVLPNGSTVEYLGTVHGTGQFTTDKAWMKAARTYLPNVITRKLPQPVTGSCGYDSNSVTVFVAVRPKPASVPWGRYVALDAAGARHEAGSGFCSFNSPSATVYGLTLRAFPRRQREFLLRLESHDRKALADFHIPNPVKGPFPLWQPQPLPQTQSNGPLALTLSSLRLHEGPDYGYVTADWVFASADPAWQQPRRPHPDFEDATGNAGSVLSFEEPAWKLRTFVHRERSQDFAHDEKLVVTNLSLPEPKTFYEPNVSGTCSGVSVTLEVVTAAGRLDLTNGTTFGWYPDTGGGSGTASSDSLHVSHWSQKEPFVVVKTTGMASVDQIQFDTVDEQGRRTRLSSYGSQTNPDGAVLSAVALKLQPGVTRFDLEIRISRPLYFEFIIDPAQIARPPQK